MRHLLIMILRKCYIQKDFTNPYLQALVIFINLKAIYKMILKLMTVQERIECLNNMRRMVRNL